MVVRAEKDFKYRNIFPEKQTFLLYASGSISHKAAHVEA